MGSKPISYIIAYTPSDGQGYSSGDNLNRFKIIFEVYHFLDNTKRGYLKQKIALSINL